MTVKLTSTTPLSTHLVWWKTKRKRNGKRLLAKCISWSPWSQILSQWDTRINERGHLAGRSLVNSFEANSGCLRWCDSCLASSIRGKVMNTDRLPWEHSISINSLSLAGMRNHMFSAAFWIAFVNVSITSHQKCIPYKLGYSSVSSIVNPGIFFFLWNFWHITFSSWVNSEITTKLKISLAISWTITMPQSQQKLPAKADPQ